MKTVDVQLAEARAVIAELSAASTRLGRWDTADAAAKEIRNILAADPAEILIAHTLSHQADELAGESARLEQLVALAEDTQAQSTICARIDLLDHRVRDLRTAARIAVTR